MRGVAEMRGFRLEMKGRLEGGRWNMSWTMFGFPPSGHSAFPANREKMSNGDAAIGRGGGDGRQPRDVDSILFKLNRRCSFAGARFKRNRTDYNGADQTRR